MIIMSYLGFPVVLDWQVLKMETGLDESLTDNSSCIHA